MNDTRVVESVTNECQSLGRAHESSSARAEKLIACLEGEITKRDEELAACRVAVENCELFRARIAELESQFDGESIVCGSYRDERDAALAELSAIKAQEPVAYISGCYRDVIDGKSDRTPLGAELAFVNMGWIGQIPLYAALSAGKEGK